MIFGYKILSRCNAKIFRIPNTFYVKYEVFDYMTTRLGYYKFLSSNISEIKFPSFCWNLIFPFLVSPENGPGWWPLASFLLSLNAIPPFRPTNLTSTVGYWPDEIYTVNEILTQRSTFPMDGVMLRTKTPIIYVCIYGAALAGGWNIILKTQSKKLGFQSQFHSA